MKKSQFNKTFRTLALSLGLGIGLNASIYTPSAAVPPTKSSGASESQFQKLLLEASDCLRLYEKERTERKISKQDTYLLCHNALKKAQQIAEKMNGGANPDKNTNLADVLILEGKFLELSGNISAEQYKQALAIREKALGPNNPKVAEALNKLAYIYVRSGALSDAADLLERSTKIMETNKGSGANDLAESIDKCMQHGLQRAVEARRITRRVANSIKKFASNNLAAQATSLHAVSLCPNEQIFAIGQQKPPTTKEDEALSQALALQEKSGGTSLKLAEFLETQAKIQNQKWQYPEAVKSYAKVVAIREALASNNISLLSRTYNTYADLLISSKNYPQAEATKKKNLALFEKHPGRENLELSNALSNMAYFYNSNKKLKESAACYERILTIQKKLEHPSTSPYENLAKIYVQLKDYQNAERILEILVALAEADAKGKSVDDNYEVRTNILNLALVKTRLGKLDAAGKYMNRVKESYERAFNKSHILYFSEKYPKEFMIFYIEYLEKAGKTAEALTMKTKLEAALKLEATICPGCGRG